MLAQLALTVGALLFVSQCFCLYPCWVPLWTPTLNSSINKDVDDIPSLSCRSDRTHNKPNLGMFTPLHSCVDSMKAYVNRQ